MATTAGGYPYPLGTDVPDVPVWNLALANKLQAALPVTVRVGSTVGSPTGGLLTITLPAGAFTAAKPTIVVSNGDAASKSMMFVEVIHNNVTATSFIVGCNDRLGAAVTAAVRVNWVASGT